MTKHSDYEKKPLQKATAQTKRGTCAQTTIAMIQLAKVRKYQFLFGRASSLNTRYCLQQGTTISSLPGIVTRTTPSRNRKVLSPSPSELESLYFLSFTNTCRTRTRISKPYQPLSHATSYEEAITHS